MTVSASHMDVPAGPAPSTAQAETVTKSVRVLLRFEGFAAFAAALAFYAKAGFPWQAFALLFLAPDLSMLAYLAGPRAGAVIYNLAHTYALALPLAVAGFIGIGDASAVTAAGLIWIAHIGFDRMLGYGLKYPTGFADTHLGRLERSLHSSRSQHRAHSRH